MRIHLDSIGCRLNEAEVENWADKFRAENHQISRAAGEADLIVFNTCAVTQQAVRRSRQAIRKLQRETPGAKVVVSGCYASLQPDDAAALGVDLVVNNHDKDNLVAIANRELAIETMPEAATLPAEVSLFARGRQRAFVKVQDGCRYRCTYCIVTVARGAERSRSIAEVVSEVNKLVASGIKEVVLTGVHLGGYGSDLDCHLSHLISAVLTETDVPRLRLGSLEPWDLPDSFFKLFANPRLMPHLHLPLQSGADSVLRRMSRRCKSAEFRALIEKAREEVPNFNVTTDIIVGFPGETEEEWRITMDYVAAIGFGHCHIFSFSPRTGTKAARLANAVPKALKKSRSQELHRLAAQMKQNFFRSQLGQTVDVLIEGEGQQTLAGACQYAGYTPNYTRVMVTADGAKSLQNALVRVKLHSVGEDGSCIYGNVVA